MRIKPITPNTNPQLAALETQITAARGRISPLYQVLLNSPAIAHGWEQMLSAVRNHNAISPAIREMVILRVAILNAAPYEFDAHVPIALTEGVTQAAIDVIEMATLNNVGHIFAPEQWLALQLTDAMTRDIVVDDDLFEQLKHHFDSKALIDLTATIAAYNMVSRFLVALQIGH